MSNDEIQKMIDTARELLAVTKVPKLKEVPYAWNEYEEDSPDTIEGFRENLRVVRKLCLWAMKEVK